MATRRQFLAGIATLGGGLMAHRARRGGSRLRGMRKAVGIFPDQTAGVITTDLNHIEAIGGQAVWVVLDMSWAFPSNSTGDSAVLAKYDEVVNQTAARNLPLIVQAHGMPTWITTASGHTWNVWHGPDTSGERTNWVACLHTFVARYGADKIAHLGIWNEPNLIEFWVQGSNADHYARLLQACYVDVKATWPGVKINGHQVARNDLGWLDAVYTATDTAFTAPTAAANNYYFDVLGIHPYCGTNTSGYSPSDTSHADETGFGGGVLGPNYTDYRRMRTAVITKEGKAKPLGFGEFGWTTTAGWYFVAEATRATYFTSAFQIARADGYVEFACPFYHRPTDPSTGWQWHGTTTETGFTNG